MNNDLRTLGIYVFLVCLGCAVLPELHADSTIYKHVDEQGNITFTNRPIKGGQKLQGVQPSSASKALTVNIAKHIPKNNVYKQNKRDIKRREILEYELTTEKKLLIGARQHLSSLRNIGNQQQKEKIRQLQNKMRRHKSNIIALRQELAKL